jgi:hypothetical protein
VFSGVLLHLAQYGACLRLRVADCDLAGIEEQKSERMAAIATSNKLDIIGHVVRVWFHVQVG